MDLAQSRDTKPASRTGGRVLADALVAQGIDHVFAVPGESYLDVLDGLYAVGNKVKLVTCRFEAGAVDMAEAYGKLNGRPAAAIVTRGPGACHGAIGVHVAMQDSTPMLLFVGQIPFEETDRESFQEVDYRRMFRPLAKWVTQIDDAARIPEIVAHAVDVATTGRPGPVVIALSEEMQKRHGRGARYRPGRRSSVRFPDPAAMARMRAHAGRPPSGRWRCSAARLERGRARRHPRFPGRLTTCRSPSDFAASSFMTGTLDNYVGDLGVGSRSGAGGGQGQASRSDPGVRHPARRAGDARATRCSTGRRRRRSCMCYPDAAEIGRVFRPALGIASRSRCVRRRDAADLQPGAVHWRGWTRELRALRAGRCARCPTIPAR